MRTVYRLIWIPSALAILGLTAYFGTQPIAIPTPAPMKRYTTGDRSVRIQHPGNWKAHERSSHGIETVLEFVPARNVRMSVTVDLQGSLVVDVLKSADTETSRIAGMIPGGEALNTHQQSPLVHLHAADGTHMKNDPVEFPGLEDGATTEARIAGKEALITTCTWTSPGIFGSQPMVGRRVTVLSGDHHVSAIYGCPKEMQKSLLPVFDTMMSSMELDVPGGAG